MINVEMNIIMKEKIRIYPSQLVILTAEEKDKGQAL
jgi:hypothetical protein